MTAQEAADWASGQHKDFESTGIKIIHPGDIKHPPAFFKFEGEVSYRRGFMQGMAYAVDRIRRLHGLGFTRPSEISNVIEDFIYSDISRWRAQTISDVRAGTRRGKDPMMGHPCLKHESWSSIRDRILRRDGGKCVQCGDVVRVQIDHIIEVQYGGTPTDENLQCLCIGCHSRKSSGR